ncbi:RNA exonuclease 4 [Plasmodiophora brassicae]
MTGVQLGANWAAVRKTIQKAGQKRTARVANATASARVRQSSDPVATPPSVVDAASAAGVVKASSEPIDATPRDVPLTSIVAIDCEMVGVGPSTKRDALARVSIVNFNGDVILDTYVKPQEAITDHRTKFSGIERGALLSAPSFQSVQKVVSDLIKDRTIVGHSVRSDLRALMLTHPRHMIRDTTNKLICPKGPKALRKLCAEHLGVTIQENTHDSVEDARAALALYKMVANKWEKRVMILHRKRKELRSKTGR